MHMQEKTGAGGVTVEPAPEPTPAPYAGLHHIGKRVNVLRTNGSQ